MGITTTSSMAKGGKLSRKKHCWECGATSVAFAISPHSGNPLCAACAAKEGIELFIEPSDEDIGTIEEGKKRATTA